MTQQVEIFHETGEDALSDVVVATGGWKRVGCELWPDKGADEAGRLLRNCLNKDRAEKLSLDQILWLLRRGHEHGVHTGMHYLADAAGYSRPDPITPDDQRSELQRQFVESVKSLTGLAKRIEGMGQPVRAVK